MRPKRATAASTAAGGSAGSARSSFAINAVAPSAATSAAVSSSVPGSGLVAERRTVEECSRRSAPVTVRAVSTRSKSRRASSRAHARPIPRLAPVTRATLRSGIGILLDVGAQLLDVAPGDAPSARAAHQLVVIADADGAAATLGKPVLRRAIGAAPGDVPVDLEALRGDRVTGRRVTSHRRGQRIERVADRAGGERAVIRRVGHEARAHEGEIAGVNA